MQKNQQFFIGIDVGTSMVRVVVGTVDDTDQQPLLSIMGVGSAPNHGMRKGTVVHGEEVTNAVTAALDEAERMCGEHIKEATVLINGAHITSQVSKGVVAISGAGRLITEEDRQRVEEAATVIQMPANREIIQVFAKNYRIDGQDNIKDPVGMQGVRLEVDTQIVSASTPLVRTLDLALEQAGITVKNKVVAGLAAAEAVLDRRQKESGTAIVDIGAGTTNIAIIEEGEIEHIAVLPVGSQHITNDLAIGLKTDLEVAEKVKQKFAKLDGSVAEKPVVDGQEFDGEMVSMIVEARVEELLELVEREFAKVKKAKKLPGGVVFVGGGAKLPGLDVFAKEKLQLPTKIGRVKGITGLIDAVDKPEFATAVGVMMLDMLLGGTQVDQKSPSNRTNLSGAGVFTKIKGYLKF